jgi:hypothetical protein
MTDRELLELAAKANGHGVYFDEVSGLTFLDDRFTRVLWNPLHNDGDALRLAVKLHLTIMLGTPGGEDVQVSAEEVGADECVSFAMEPLAADPYAATRRAIVRAAAATGAKDAG